MTFGSRLNELITKTGISNKELSGLSGISSVSVWRYRNGTRVPKRDSKEVANLAKGLALAAKDSKLSEAQIYTLLNETLTSPEDDKAVISALKTIMHELELSTKELSAMMEYDPSFLSKVLREKAEPTKLDAHTAALAAFLASDKTMHSRKIILCRLIGCDIDIISDSKLFYEKICAYLSPRQNGSIKHRPATVDSFVKKLDEFDLEDYINAIRFNDIIVPTAPIQLPRSKYYTGIDQMKASELDFMRSTILSRSKEPVFSYSDMPIKEMSSDSAFSKKYMLGLAMMIKKGLHLNLIHDVNRPFEEMMIGLEAFIPLYMTGQISPYYLTEPNGKLTNLLLKVSGAAALHGEAINGYHAMGRYFFSSKEEDLRYYKLQSELMLSKCKPLMEIYTAEKKDEYTDFFFDSFTAKGERKYILSSLPCACVSDELLENLLRHNSITGSAADNIRSFITKARTSFERLLEREKVTLVIPCTSGDSFEANASTLWLPGLFLNFGLSYTKELFKKHAELTKRLAKKYPACTLETNDRPGFKNIDITVIKGTRVIVSKAKSPTIHFVINHPRMVEAFENFSMPIVE